MPENDGFHWLTYESLFNKTKFKKPKCEFKLGLYLIPFNELTIWIRDEISNNDLQAFVDAFFPDIDKETLKEVANGFWSWRHKDSDLVGVQQGNTLICSPRKTNGDRKILIIYVMPYAVLPYNRFDNTSNSNALGTRDHDGLLLRLKAEEPYFWSTWKTASRSCVVKLPDVPVKKKGTPWLPINATSLAQPFSPWTYSDEHRRDGFENLADQPFDLATSGNRAFSLKTGVEFVGKNNQGGYFHKDIIGDWLIGCLRSDYIVMVDKQLKPPKEGLRIHTELITITEKRTRSHTGKGGLNFKEGVQVRDLSVLDKFKVYFAPLNIPFVGPGNDGDFNILREEFYFLTDAVDEPERQKWCDYWKVAFAAALGRSKALLMLRYGLQILNPNQQNFLIEFDKKDGGLVPTGNIAIRDLNDASIHREVVWALFNGPGLPPTSREDLTRLAELDVPTFKFEFEDGRMAREGFGNQDCQETGSTATDFGPSGTQFLWQRFSAFVNGDKPGVLKGEEAINRVWKNLLWAMADWGMAHNKAYITAVEIHLGINFRDIDWNKYKDPARYKTLANIDQAQLHAMKSRSVFNSTDSATLSITGVVGFTLPGTKTAWEQKFDPMQYPFRDDLKTKPCLTINGVGLNQTSVVSFGSRDIPANQVFITRNGSINVQYDLNTPDAEAVKLILLRRIPLKVTNPGPVVATATGSPDPDEPGDMGWEEISAKVIHDYLASAPGQAALKACRDRKWALIKPSFTIRLKGPDNRPFAWKKVFFKSVDMEWTDLTNRKGELYIYNNVARDLRICPKKDETVVKGAEWLPCLNAEWRGITIDIG